MNALGQVVVAPEGFKGLTKNRSYFFVGNGDAGRVSLAFFSSGPPKVFLEQIPQTDFYEAFEDGHLKKGPCQLYPLWIQELMDSEVVSESDIAGFLERNTEKIERRYMAIKPLLSEVELVATSPKPFTIVNRYARTHSYNQQRLRLHFFSYLCFSDARAALAPNTLKNGHWERRDGQAKSGRKDAKTGADSGFAMSSEMSRMSVAGYWAHRNAAETYNEMYLDTLFHEFGCREREIDGEMETFHPLGEPFPSYGQWLRAVKDVVGQKKMDVHRWGRNRTRNRHSPIEGSFSESVINLLDRIEGDAYSVTQVITGSTGEFVPPLYIVRLIDSLSGNRLGIGASIGGEKASAYQMALFSMCMEKQFFCSLFGITIGKNEWLNAGLPLSYVLDRGPGSAKGLLESMNTMIPHIENAVAYSGQSKALCESTHPRSTDLTDDRIFRTTRLTYLQYLKREIVKTVEENCASDVSARLTKELIEAGIKPRPNDLWNYFDDRLRSAQRSVSKEDAIRTFLNKVPCIVKRDGVHMEDFLTYKSPAFDASGLSRRVKRNQSMPMEAYVVPMCLRKIWLDDFPNLIELDMKVPMRAHGEEDTTLADLERLTKIRRATNRKAGKQNIAAGIRARSRYDESTGEALNTGGRQRKPPKRKSKSAMDEVAELNRMSGVTSKRPKK